MVEGWSGFEAKGCFLILLRFGPSLPLVGFQVRQHQRNQFLHTTWAISVLNSTHTMSGITGTYIPMSIQSWNPSLQPRVRRPSTMTATENHSLLRCRHSHISLGHLERCVPKLMYFP